MAMEATEINTFVKRLNQKLEHVEQEVVNIRRELKQLRESVKIEVLPQTAEEKYVNRLERMRLKKEKLQPIVDEVFKKMGIHGEPIGAENVQKMIAACGIKPEDNEFSRGIIEMREE
jgi:hypothetical protein